MTKQEKRKKIESLIQKLQQNRQIKRDLVDKAKRDNRYDKASDYEDQITSINDQLMELKEELLTLEDD